LKKKENERRLKNSHAYINKIVENYRSVKNVKVQCSSCNVRRRTKKIRTEVRGTVGLFGKDAESDV